MTDRDWTKERNFDTLMKFVIVFAIIVLLAIFGAVPMYNFLSGVAQKIIIP